MNTDQYQAEVMRTCGPRSTRDRFDRALKGMESQVEHLKTLLKAYLLDGAELPQEEAMEQASDLLWYLSLFCTTLGVTLEEVMDANVEKLHRRFPNGHYIETLRRRWNGKKQEQEP